MLGGVFLALLVVQATASLSDILEITDIQALTPTRDGKAAYWSNCTSACQIFGSQGQVSTFPDDDGLYTFSQLLAVGDKGLVFVRGPTDAANPSALLIPPKAAVWYYAGGSAPPEMLFTSEVSLLEASHDAIYWFESGTLWKMTLPEATKVAVLTLQGDQGAVVQVRESPSGLLFVNDRNDHFVIGWVANNATNIVWIGSMILDSVLGPALLSPDQSHVAYLQVFPNVTAGGITMGYQVSLMLGSINGTVWKVVDFYELGLEQYANGDRRMYWLNSSHVVVGIVGPEGFDPFNHVALINVLTGSVTDLFAGQSCDVLSYQVAYGMLLATHNCGFSTSETQGITLHNLTDLSSTVVLAGKYGVVAGLADEQQFGAVLLADGSVVFLMSFYDTQMAVYRRGSDGNVALYSQPPWATSVPFVLPKLVTFQTEFLINAHLFEPNATKFPKPYPTVVFTHGGSMRQMYPAFHPMLDYSLRYAFNQYLASVGIAVLSVNYRTGVGYGTKFQYCEGCGRLGAAEWLDVLAAGKWLQNQTFVEKIGIYGLSYGGLNALQAATRAPDVFVCSVANAPVFNWVSSTRSGDSDYTTLYFQKTSAAISYWPPEDLTTPSWPSLVDDNVKLFYLSSPIAYVSPKMAPTLVIQGDSDRDVEVQASIGLVNLARRIGAPVESLFFPNEMHGLSLISSKLRAFSATEKFLREHLAK